MSSCLSRYTKEEFAQHFGNGRNKFYIEFRCNRPCPKEINRCAQCLEKSATAIQTSRRFEHGNINDPIPDKSHIYGGKWFHDSSKKFGMPPSEIIEFALSYQRESRGYFVVEQPEYEVKDKKHSKTDEMSRSKKTVMSTAADADTVKTDTPTRRLKTPQIASDKISTPIETDKIKRERKKPQIVTMVSDVEIKAETKEVIDVPKKRVAAGGAGRKSKKAEVNPYSSLINSSSGHIVYKEVTLPTHLETSLDEFDTDRYEIEYVKLSLFEHKSISYFRDSSKNKLYKKIKDNGIGDYIGRYDPDTESIITDIPDSDDEE